MNDDDNGDRDDKFAALLRAAPKPARAPSVETKCPECGHIVSPYYRRCPKCEGDRNRLAVDAMAVVIRQLKASRSPEQEYTLLKQLREMGHPDLDGLVKAIRTRLDSGGAPKRGKRETT